MQQKYTRDANRRIQWHPHWEQGICRRCGAWLEELPAHAIQSGPARWRLTWVCVVCAFEETVSSGKPLTAFLPDPDAEIAPPGLLPVWRGWRLPLRLVQDIIWMAERYARPVTRDDLTELPSVLDHEGVCRADWGVFTGSDEDPSGIRLWMARLRHAPAPVTGSRLAALIAERAVLAAGAVFEELARAELLAMAIAESHARNRCEMDRILSVPFMLPSDLDCGETVAPVIGAGRLSIANRYEDWLLTHGAHPWFGDGNRGIGRAPIPDGTEWAASCIELADAILNALELFHNEDSTLDQIDDVTTLQTLMGEWRRMQMGSWDVTWHWRRHWPKLPNSFWLRRWEPR
jgi:hypothetical protein